MGNKLVEYPSFQLHVIAGEAPVAGADPAPGTAANPLVSMRYSNNGGETFGNTLTRKSGQAGEYGRRLKWDNCGMGRRRVFEVSGFGPLTILGASIAVSPKELMDS